MLSAPPFILLVIISGIYGIYLYLKFKNSFYSLLSISLFLYILSIISVVFLPIPVQQSLINSLRESPAEYQINAIQFIPLHTLREVIFNSNYKSILRNAFLNMMMGVPLLFIIGLLNQKMIRNFKKVFIISLSFGSSIEVIQFIIGKSIGYFYRNIDIDDIIFNAVGALTGYIIFLSYRKFLNPKSIVNSNLTHRG